MLKAEYFYSNGIGELSLAICADEADIASAIKDIEAHGNGDEDWDEWRVGIAAGVAVDRAEEIMAHVADDLKPNLNMDIFETEIVQQIDARADHYEFGGAYTRSGKPIVVTL